MSNEKNRIPESVMNFAKAFYDESLKNDKELRLTKTEHAERERLLELQSNHSRWFSQQEFDRLKELSNKMFKNAGSPHCG